MRPSPSEELLTCKVNFFLFQVRVWKVVTPNVTQQRRRRFFPIANSGTLLSRAHRHQRP